MNEPRARWLRGPLWDSALLAWCWIPFYLWFVFGLGIGREALGWEALGRAEGKAALATAIVVVLALTWVHRHYTFVLVYGDRDTFRRRARDFLLAPAVLLLVVILARGGRGVALLQLGSFKLTPWVALLTVSGSWNIWHTIQQRYGIFRIYGGKSGGGLEAAEHGRRDRAMLWSSVLLMSTIVVGFRLSTFVGHSTSRRILKMSKPLLSSPWAWLALGVLAAFSLVFILRWARYEISADLTMAERVPRLNFLGSTFVLMGVFILHGPIVGYLCFAVTHAVEYIAFVHHFGEGKFQKRGDDRGLAARLLRNPLPLWPLLVVGMGVPYLALQPWARTDVYLAYYFTTSMLHFLFDGWIWKVRRPEVARPLGVAAAP